MDASTVNRRRREPTLAPASRLPPGGSSARRGGRRHSELFQLHRPALALLLVLALLVRLWGVKQGLPYSYNSDEANHFVPKAVGFFSGDLNPHYFLNPPAYSYLLFVIFELWFGSADAVRSAYTSDPTAVFVVGRVLVAVLGTGAVWLTYLAGARLFDRAVALLGAAVLALAFLPVFYSHLALNDVPTLAPVALALYAVAGILTRGRTRDYVIAGIGVGLAAAFKYTGGIMVVCLLLAAVCDGAVGSPRAAAGNGALALALALVAFVAANPYSLLDPSAFFSGVGQQASLAAGAEPVKLGSAPGSGIVYYLWTFTWGLGWVPALAAVAGAGLLAWRRRAALGIVLVPATVAFIVFMGVQQRYFGRWLMPVFPIVGLLGAWPAVEAARWVSRTRGVAMWLSGSLAGVLMLAQSAAAVVHNDAVLSRPDTRNLTRNWMVAHVPAGSKVVIEPLVPANWAMDVGRPLPYTPIGARWRRWPTSLTRLDARGNLLPRGERRVVAEDQYERVLYPALLRSYAKDGYCWVMIGSLQAGRAFAQPQDAPRAVAYYAALARHGRLVFHISPFARGARAVPFSFDWSIDYYPRQYRLPGPEISVYRLHGARCGP